MQNIETHNNPEIAPELISQHVSLVMIKPENMDRSVLFPHILKNYGFNTEVKRVKMTEEHIKGIYPEIDSWSPLIQQATRENLLDSEVDVILLSADESSIPHENILEEVAKLKGDKTDPFKCAPGTLRNVHYGDKLLYENKETGETASYWENGIHCPVNTTELMSNLETFDLKEKAIEITKNKLNIK